EATRAKAATHQVASHRTAHRLGDDETEPGRLRALAIENVDDRIVGRHSTAPAQRGAKVCGTGHTIRPSEHGGGCSGETTRTALSGPCGGAHRGSRGRREYACAVGSRELSRGGDCSAGRFACS